MSAIVTASTISRDQLDLLKRTYAADTSDDEFMLFVAAAERLGLDPFAKQIYAVCRKDKRTNRKKMSIQCGIDGFRSVAERSGELDGQEGPFWCGADGVWQEVWASKSPPVASKVVVYRKTSARGFTGLAHYNEYVQRDSNGVASMWRAMPALMLSKCAEALALRKAFPSKLSGVYTSDEMGQSIDADADLDGELVVESREPTSRREHYDRLPESSSAKPEREPLSDATVDEMVVVIRATTTLDELDPLRDRARDLRADMTREQKKRIKDALDRADRRMNGEEL